MNGGLANGQGAAAPPKNPLEPLQRKLQVRPVGGGPGGSRTMGDCTMCLSSQVYLDKSTPHVLYRWLALVALALVYAVRVYFLKGCGHSLRASRKLHFLC